MHSFRTALAGCLAGLSMVAAGLAGVGTAAAQPLAGSADYTLTRATDWAGHPVIVRWAPCTRIAGVTRTHVIRYRVNTAGHPGRVNLVKQGIARLHTASGLTFRYVGTTSYLPHYNSQGIFASHEQHRVTGVPLVVAWAFQGTGPQHSNLLTGTEAGVGTISWKSSPTSQLRIVAGAVVIKRGTATSMLAGGFRAGGSLGSLLLHELGHVVGLEHVLSDDTQVMYPFIGATTPADYAAGDRAGLARVGRPAGCMTTPSLSP